MKKPVGLSPRGPGLGKRSLESQRRSWRGHGLRATGATGLSLGSRRGPAPPLLEKMLVVPGKQERQGSLNHCTGLGPLQNIKPLGGSRGKPRKPGALGGITRLTISWMRAWTSTRGRSTFMRGPGRHHPQTSTNRKLPSNPGDNQRTLVSTENFPPYSGPRRDVPPRDKLMPSVQKAGPVPSGTHGARPRSLSSLTPGKLQRGPGRAVAEQGLYLAITGTQRTTRPQTHRHHHPSRDLKHRAASRPRTPGGRTHGP